MKKILIVENDLNLGTTLTDALEMQDFKVLYLATDEGIMSKFYDFQPDIVILDVMLHGTLDGFEIAKLMREENNTPILFTTSRDGQEDFQKGFSINNSDYVRKPYRLMEIILRLKKLLPNPKIIDSPETFQLGNYSFFPIEQLLMFDGEKINLDKRESTLLNLLCKNTDVFMSRNKIIERIWNEKESKSKAGSLNNVITNLRKYLQQDDRIILESRIGLGVRLLIK
ncbi:MAG: response regulator transcription factor [Paludibacter sp.]